MKKGISLIIAFLMLTGLCSCGSSDEKISMYDLQKIMLGADAAFPEMKTASSASEDAESNFSYISSDFDYSKIDSYTLAYSSQGLADEIVVIRLKKASDASSATAALQKHAQNRVELYRTYMPEQTQRAQKAVIFSSGCYAVLVIGDNAQSVKNAFENAVK